MMSNRVDFFQGECKDLVIPAARCEVFVEGGAYPFLEVVEIVQEGWPRFGRALLRYNPAAYEGSKSNSIEQIERIAAMGKRVEICRPYNAGIGEVRIEPVWIFVGRVEHIEMRLGPKEQILEITAKDFSARLDRVTISGRRVATTGGESTFNDGLEAVFNENDLPNASTQQVQHNCTSYTAFAGDGQETKYWSVAEVIIYILSEYLPFGQLQVPLAAFIEVLTGQKVADELDVEGKSVLEAVSDCCERAQIQFIFMPRQAEPGPREQIVFYHPGEGSRVELNLQYAGEQISISRTNVCELESQKQNEPSDSGIIETIDVQTPIIATHYEVGDRVTVSPDSRDILGVRRDNRSIFWIDRVKIDFEKQCTDLRILRRRANV
jgi:hypothetical protein